ncbi:MAG TPA: hypothetical protein VI981_00325 [Candidatus Paceibacterota bacterium]
MDQNTQIFTSKKSYFKGGLYLGIIIGIVTGVFSFLRLDNYAQVITLVPFLAFLLYILGFNNGKGITDKNWFYFVWGYIIPLAIVFLISFPIAMWCKSNASASICF